MPKGHFLEILFLIFISAELSKTLQVSFRGSEIITLDLTMRTIAAKDNRITFRFKTIHPFGVILYSRGTQGDYISIDLVEGKLR